MSAPRVAIAIPVYNAAPTIRRALESALGQTHEDIEIVISDNASTDETVAIVRSYDDPRIRLYRSATNIGALPNINRSIELCRAPLVKFLHADDELYPRCVERMVETMDRSERIGLVFSRRRIDIPPDAHPDYQTFREVFEHAYRHLAPLEPVNDGRELLRRLLRARLSENWVGEPSNVMMRRSALERVGLFDPRLSMLNDLNLWARTMARYDVGFVDEELSAYSFHSSSVTIAQGVEARWLDPLWTLEALAADQELVAALPELRPALAQERRKVAKRIVLTAAREPARLGARLRTLRGYLGYRLRSVGGRPARSPYLPA